MAVQCAMQREGRFCLMDLPIGLFLKVHVKQSNLEFPG